MSIMALTLETLLQPGLLWFLLLVGLITWPVILFLDNWPWRQGR